MLRRGWEEEEEEEEEEDIVEPAVSGKPTFSLASLVTALTLRCSTCCERSSHREEPLGQRASREGEEVGEMKGEEEEEEEEEEEARGRHSQGQRWDMTVVEWHVSTESTCESNGRGDALSFTHA